ncbi:zinc finger protein 888-like [Trichogramma pretiosum]|uniref:zinc finger protein 888-like n=1 Tax=Trichogramma pretiosum TaxID=7493 RepID=UPI0006C956F2|nr:zinc finger protein 888-like [Trichogramma pretiosum]
MPSKICYACVHANAESCVFEGAEFFETHKRNRHPELICAELAKCPVCLVAFRSDALLREHIGRDHEDLAKKIERVRRSFKCSYCLDDVFRSPEAARQHARSRHGHELLECRPCGLSFEHVYLHERHQLDAHAITPTYECSCQDVDCDFESADLFDVHEHVREAHEKQSNHFTGTHATRETQGPEASEACTLCEARFRRSEDKFRHIVEQHETCLLIGCKLCTDYRVQDDLDGAVQHALEAHDRLDDIDALFSIRILKVPRPKDCRRCRQRFGRTQELADHLLWEHDQMLAFACRACGIEVHDEPDSLLRHAATAHHWDELAQPQFHLDGVYDVLVCSSDLRARCLVPACRQKFKDEDDGLYHYREAHEDDAYNLFMCVWCQAQGRARMFTTQVALGRHVERCYSGLGPHASVFRLYTRPNLRCCKLSIVDVPAEYPATSPDSGHSSG